ncbi:MAG: type II toxin-antitoxin system HicB family antitoxin, partial [Longimicrobiaceae bacterium]
TMRNEFTAVVERDGEWFIAYCPEIPGANGQGRTRDECLENLADAIELVLEDRAAGNPRMGWEEAFEAMHARGDDELLHGDQVGNSSWDDKEWEWALSGTAT